MTGSFEEWGFIPSFLHADDPRPAAEQFNERYPGGWQNFPGLTFNRDGVTHRQKGLGIVPQFQEATSTRRDGARRRKRDSATVEVSMEAPGRAGSHYDEAQHGLSLVGDPSQRKKAPANPEGPAGASWLLR